MIFRETPLEGAWLIGIEPITDQRGFFARVGCEREARAVGIDVRWVQANVSRNRRCGTLRGMHWQEPDFEAKLVRVTRGAIWDVIVDIRPRSATYRQHLAVELSEDNGQSLFVPEGFAHGFVTLCDHTEVSYQMSRFYVPEQARGFRYDDPAIGIPWPQGDKILSPRDRDLPPFGS